MLQKKELALQWELAEKQCNLTTEQSERMMQQHREEMQLLESSSTQEKDQQKETLAKKIAEKNNRLLKNQHKRKGLKGNVFWQNRRKSVICWNLKTQKWQLLRLH